MTDTELIFLILAMFYLAECCAWIPLAATALSGWWRKLGIGQPLSLSGNETGLSFCNPLPFSRSHIVSEWPVVITPDGIGVPFSPPIVSSSDTDQSTTGEAPTDEQTSFDHSFLPYSQLKKVGRRDKLLFINGQPIKTASADAARHYSVFLTSVLDVSEAKRKHLVAEELDQHTNLEAAKERALNVRDDSGSVRMMAAMLFLLLFIYGPILYYKQDGPWSEALLMRYLLVFGMFWVTTIVVFWLTSGRTTNASRGERSKRAAMMLFSPAMAMRSGDYALRGSLHRFHPVIAAAACSSEPNADQFAAKCVRRLKLQPIAATTSGSTDYVKAVEWNTAEIHQRLTAQLEAAEFESTSWFAPPERDGDANSFCPLCRNQFTMTEGNCEECNGLALQSFQSSAVSPNT